jgi:hypothetical protein
MSKYVLEMETIAAPYQARPTFGPNTPSDFLETSAFPALCTLARGKLSDYLGAMAIILIQGARSTPFVPQPKRSCLAA